MARFKAVLFDLGGTLVEYYKSSEFQDILERAMNDIQEVLFEKMAITYEHDDLWKRVEEENREAGDFRVRPMEDRLVNIFQLQDFAKESAFMTKLCSIFLHFIFEKSNVYPDTVQTLQEIKNREYKIGLVSNTPWGSPAILWREELGKLGLLKYFDITVFCRDVGWRKPAGQVFNRALSMLKLDAKDCLFVGDDPRWDVSGPRAIGMDAVLINRSGETRGNASISSLQELLAML
jgi:putative hydrolase of the HAD superfamily